DPQGREARRPAGAAVHQGRAVRQPENRQGARRDHAALDSRPRRRGDRMRRRDTLTLLGSAATSSLLWPLGARAQQPLPTVGVVYGVSAAEWADPIDSMRRGLSEAGFVEGRSVAIEFRWAEGHLDRVPVMAAELIARRVAVLLMGGNTAAVRSVVAAAQTTP